MVDKVLHAQMPFTTGRQTVNDRLTAAYHSLAGSQIGKTVCKATTEEPIGPKKKHLDYLLHCTHEPNVNIPQLANCLVERTTNSNWCVVYKSLITIHNLMCYGNERFSQYLASSNANFNLGNFLDKASMQGYDMSTYVRRYAKYITEKIYNYRIMAFDFCKVKRGREDGLLRTMSSDKLLKTLPALQSQIDALLEFQVSSNDLTNGVINSCFILLFRDLIRLFACYNDGVINLLEKFFDMNKKQCREALDLYKSFLLRMDKVAEFLKIAESVGIDRGEIPDLAKAPGSLLEALEQHVNAVEGQKGSSGAGRVTSASTGLVATAQTAIQTFSKGYTEPKSGYVDPSAIDENVKRKILEEEEQRLNLLKEQRMRELEFREQKLSETKNSKVEVHNFANANVTNKSPEKYAPTTSVQASAIDDLLSLDVPISVPVASSTNPFITNHGFYNQQTSFNPTTSFSNEQSNVGFANENSFAKAFGIQETTKGFNRSGDALISGPPHVTNFTQDTKKINDAKLVAGDLDGSLASLAENFSIGKGHEDLKSKPVQWGPSKANNQSLGLGSAGYNNISWNTQSSMNSQMFSYQQNSYSPITSSAGMSVDTTMLAYGQPRPLNAPYVAGGFGTAYGPNLIPNKAANMNMPQYGVNKNPFEAL